MTDSLDKSGYAAPDAPQPDELRGSHLALVVTRWNRAIVDALVRGAEAALRDWQVDDAQWHTVAVPGAFEVPLACELLARSRSVDAIITLGAVIRGDTPHFDFVAGECARGIQDVSLRHAMPIGFGVLTVNTVDQARARCAEGRENKGFEATLAALEMLRLRRSTGV